MSNQSHWLELWPCACAAQGVAKVSDVRLVFPLQTSLYNHPLKWTTLASLSPPPRKYFPQISRQSRSKCDLHISDVSCHLMVPKDTPSIEQFSANVWKYLRRWQMGARWFTRKHDIHNSLVVWEQITIFNRLQALSTGNFANYLICYSFYNHQGQCAIIAFFVYWHKPLVRANSEFLNFQTILIAYKHNHATYLSRTHKILLSIVELDNLPCQGTNSRLVLCGPVRYAICTATRHLSGPHGKCLSGRVETGDRHASHPVRRLRWRHASNLIGPPVCVGPRWPSPMIHASRRDTLWPSCWSRPVRGHSCEQSLPKGSLWKKWVGFMEALFLCKLIDLRACSEMAKIWQRLARERERERCKLEFISHAIWLWSVWYGCLGRKWSWQNWVIKYQDMILWMNRSCRNWCHQKALYQPSIQCFRSLVWNVVIRYWSKNLQVEGLHIEAS